jgi:hypothetical protein
MLNQVVLVGKVKDIKKEKGRVISIRVSIGRSGQPEVIDEPKVTIPPNILHSELKEGQTIAIKARIATEKKGGYGTVSNIIAERLTLLELGTNE